MYRSPVYSENIMKIKMLVLVGVLAISLPAVLFAQGSSTPSGQEIDDGGIIVPLPPVPSTSCPIPANPNAVIDWKETIICLQNRIDGLDKRVRALESGTKPGNVCPVGCVCSGEFTMCASVQETKTIQSFLKEEGSFTYPIATGFYGTITKEAVRKFQVKQGLTATGLVDKATLEKMKSLAPTIAPSASSSMQGVSIP